MPITLRVQNDQGGVLDANAYIDVQYFRDYHAENGNVILGPDGTEVEEGEAGDEIIKVGIIRGKNYIDSGAGNAYKGEEASRDGSSAFPRYNLTNRSGDLVTGISLPLKKANAEYGLIGCAGHIAPTPAQDASGARVVQMSERVGPISESKTFADGGAYARPEYPVADAILRAAGYVMMGGQIIRG